MTIEQFWSSTWREVQLLRLAAERRHLSEDRRTRTIAYAIYKYAGWGPGKNPVSEKIFMPLPGDTTRAKKKEHDTPYLTVNQLAESINKHYNERH